MTTEFYRKLAEYNEPAYNKSKLAEELCELLECLLKMQNKKGEHIPPREHFIEELGDVQLRLNVVILQEKAGDEVRKRIMEKTEKLQGFIDNNTYTKNI